MKRLNADSGSDLATEQSAIHSALQVLGLACTQVGDTVLRRGLLRCTQLVKLNLSRTRITDNGEVDLQAYGSQHSCCRLTVYFPQV